MTRCAAVVLTLCGALLCAGQATADEAKKVPKEIASFGTLRATAPEMARSQAEEWLKGVGKTDAATQTAFAALWDSDRTLLDKVADTLSLGSPDARKLLDEVRDPKSAAPTEVPALVKDKKLPSFFRANLALAYAKALSNRRIYEEALESLEGVKPEQVVDPATLLFHKAVAEHSLMMAREANNTIVRLLDDVTDAPERYKMVAALMVFDMMTWKDKDLGSIARKMDNIERRLDLSRGGPKTQKIQKEVVARLDELIKEKENQSKGCGS
jgi:predicted secreted Zn-dependent protease